MDTKEIRRRLEDLSAEAWGAHRMSVLILGMLDGIRQKGDAAIFGKDEIDALCHAANDIREHCTTVDRDADKLADSLYTEKEAREEKQWIARARASERAQEAIVERQLRSLLKRKVRASAARKEAA
jgi:hypothetical protein